MRMAVPGKLKKRGPVWWRMAALTLLLGSFSCSYARYNTYPERAPHFSQIGWASYYDASFDGRRTASGEPYRPQAFTAANRSLPLGTRVWVTNWTNGRRVAVRINDRGPWVHGRIIDLSWAAAKRLRMLKRGVARVRIEVF